MCTRATSSRLQFAPRPAAPRQFYVVLRSRAIPQTANSCLAINSPAFVRRSLERLSERVGAPAIGLRLQASSTCDTFLAWIAFAPHGFFARRKLQASHDWPCARAAVHRAARGSDPSH